MFHPSSNALFHGGRAGLPATAASRKPPPTPGSPCENRQWVLIERANVSNSASTFPTPEFLKIRAQPPPARPADSGGRRGKRRRRAPATSRAGRFSSTASTLGRRCICIRCRRGDDQAALSPSSSVASHRPSGPTPAACFMAALPIAMAAIFRNRRNTDSCTYGTPKRLHRAFSRGWAR